MSTAKLPIGSRPDDGRFRGGRLRLVEGVGHPDPPPAPAHLSRREAELYRAAWREPESCLWRRSDAARVARWAHLAARAETDPASWVFTQLNVLERQLVMTPLARAAAGVTLEPAGATPSPRAAAAPAAPPLETLARRAAELARLRRDDPLGVDVDDDDERERRGRGVVSGDDLAALLYLAGGHPDPFVRCACAARALELRGAAVTAAPTGGEVGPQSPVPPKLVASDRRGVDARRWEFVIPPSLAAELGDSTELEHHRDTFKRWEAAAARVGDLLLAVRRGARARPGG